MLDDDRKLGTFSIGTPEAQHLNADAPRHTVMAAHGDTQPLLDGEQANSLFDETTPDIQISRATLKR